MEHTTVRELVSKANAISVKMAEVMQAIKILQDRNYHETEIMERAKKDKRYAVQLLLQEYERLEADYTDIMNTPVRLLND